MKRKLSSSESKETGAQRVHKEKLDQTVLLDQKDQWVIKDQRDELDRMVQRDQLVTKVNLGHEDPEEVTKETSRGKLHQTVELSTRTTTDLSDPQDHPDHRDHKDLKVFQDRPVFPVTSASTVPPVTMDHAEQKVRTVTTETREVVVRTENVDHQERPVYPDKLGSQVSKDRSVSKVSVELKDPWVIQEMKGNQVKKVTPVRKVVVVTRDPSDHKEALVQMDLQEVLGQWVEEDQMVHKDLSVTTVKTVCKEVWEYEEHRD